MSPSFRRGRIGNAVTSYAAVALAAYSVSGATDGVAFVAKANAGEVPNTSSLGNPVIRAWELPLHLRTVISSVDGTVHITRNGKSVVPAVGAEIRPGDLLGVEKGSSITLQNSTGGKVTITANGGGWYKFVAGTGPSG